MITAREAREYADSIPTDAELQPIEDAIKEAASNKEDYILWYETIPQRTINYLIKIGYQVIEDWLNDDGDMYSTKISW